MIRLPASLCLLGAVLMSACAASAEPQTTQPGAMPSSRKPVPVQPAQQPSAQPAAGEVPASVVEKLRADLAKQQSVAAADVKLVSAQAVVWPNGGLGCAKPGEMVTQAIVPGYRVEFEVGGRRYAYHAAERGYFRLCQGAEQKGLERDAVK